jgi:hypothetical protein
MIVAELLKRAKSARGKKIRYKLSAGGMSPGNPTPANINNECDCSGFVCWCLGICRKTDHPLYEKFNGGWINTDAIVHDAKTPFGYFEELTTPKVGALVVYPRDNAKDTCGHVGVITEISAGTGVDAIASVIHCSSGNSKRGDAIDITSPAVFKKSSTIIAWYAGVIS